MEEATAAKRLPPATSEGSDRLPLERYRIVNTVPDDSVLFKVLFGTLRGCLGARWLAKLSKNAHENRLPGEDIWNSYVRHIGVIVEVRGFSAARIPTTGPLVIVANHPTGMVDGHLLGSILEKNVRTDFKILTVPRYCELPALKDRLVPVYLPSPSGRHFSDADRLNREAREAVRRHVLSGGAMVMFPCGAARIRTSSGRVQDGTWRHGAFALAAKTGAKVVPVHIDAPIPPMRDWMFRIHPVLWYAADPLDARYLRGKTARVTFGDPDSAELKEALSDLSTAPEKIRELVYRLPARV